MALCFTTYRNSGMSKTSKKQSANTAQSSRIVVACRSIHSLLQRLALWTSVGKNSYQLFLPRHPTSTARRSHNPKVVEHRAAPANQKERTQSPERAIEFFCLKRVKRCLNRGKNEEKVNFFSCNIVLQTLSQRIL